MSIFVDSEIGTLHSLVVHSPDSGLGIVVPSKAQDWLFEDIIHLPTMRQEYDQYLLILLYFLDPSKVKGKLERILKDPNRSFFKPSHGDHHSSNFVLEFQRLLADILVDQQLKSELVASVCALENCPQSLKKIMLELSNKDLANVLITGAEANKNMVFPPIPNLIFTRDLGIVVNDHLIVNKPARPARSRESLLAKYVFFNHEIFKEVKDKIIEAQNAELFFLKSDEEISNALATVEGGDVMTISPNHLLIGISERTTLQAAQSLMYQLFDKQVVEKVTFVKIPHKRDYMHIDTIFTQVKKNVWVLLDSLGKNASENDETFEEFGKTKPTEHLIIKQFVNGKNGIEHKNFAHLESLLDDVSQNDLKADKPTEFVYSGGGKFPFNAREQWTDSSNLLVIKEGVAIAYDRNDFTLEQFKSHGFKTIRAIDLLWALEKGELTTETLTDTIILLPSAELSRARGGSHCMSMPISRKL